MSRLFGHFTRVRLPKSLLNAVTRWYCRAYGVNTDEIRYPEEGFTTFNQFFTRKLIPGTHRIDPVPGSIVSPVDGRIDQFGSITGDTLLQAKGVEYSLEELLPNWKYSDFKNGTFVTLYLSPADYHRIHSPVGGTVYAYQVVPGALYTVQDWLVKRLPGLFTANERVISYIDAKKGRVAVCKVGAMNVGRISLSYADVVSNRSMIRKFREHEYTSGMGPVMAKGDELGIFQLGSTVILLFEKNTMELSTLEEGQKVRMGDVIGRFKGIFA